MGGGNHFIEIDVNSKGEYYLVIHTGSRNLGKQVAEIYQNKAILYHENRLFNKKEAITKVITEYKQTGRQKEIQAEIQRISQMYICRLAFYIKLIINNIIKINEESPSNNLIIFLSF